VQKTLITKGGKISIKGLPFHAGESVEVIVRRGKKSARAGKYSLHGKPMTYRVPFKGVAVGDWDAMQ
jgi:hypothetical protein